MSLRFPSKITKQSLLVGVLDDLRQGIHPRRPDLLEKCRLRFYRRNQRGDDIDHFPAKKGVGFCNPLQLEGAISVLKGSGRESNRGSKPTSTGFPCFFMDSANRSEKYSRHKFLI